MIQISLSLLYEHCRALYTLYIIALFIAIFYILALLCCIYYTRFVILAMYCYLCYHMHIQVKQYKSMHTFIFEYSSPTLYKVVEYRSRKKTLTTVRPELITWGYDIAKHFNDNADKATLTGYTMDEGAHILETYKKNN